MRRGIKKRIDNRITNESFKDYGIKFKNCYKRFQTIEEWNRVKDALVVVKKPEPIKPIQYVKLRKIKDDDWSKASSSELKDGEKRQRLLEEVKNVDL